MGIKTCKFLLSLMDSELMRCKEIPNQELKKVKCCVELMQKLLINIHVSINNIILISSENLTGIKMPKIPEEKIQDEVKLSLMNCFISEKFTKDLKFDQKIPLHEEQERINKLA